MTAMYTKSHSNSIYYGRKIFIMAELKEVLKVVEGLRKKLNQMSREKELTDPEVISASQMLDVALNEYQKIMKDKGK